MAAARPVGEVRNPPSELQTTGGEQAEGESSQDQKNVCIKNIQREFRALLHLTGSSHTVIQL